MNAYHWSHRVTFDETNVVGNVYFAHFLHWQGRCRETFLADHAPGVLEELNRGDFAMATVACDMEFYAECFAFDEIDVGMALRRRQRTRMRMDFDFRREGERIASGSQTVACLRRTPSGVVPVDVPPELCEALVPYEKERSTTW
jgi:enediyne biosynthesis thioesterase